MDDSADEGRGEDEEQPLWSIDDDSLFHPLGLTSHGSSAGKCVFVTWGADYLLNFVFKTSATTNRTKMTKVRLNVDPDVEVCDVLITELNTLARMQCGRVYYFSSVKAMHPISWLNNGVRCLSLARDGFSLIRVHPKTYSISLEVYRDVAGMGKYDSTILRYYDISFDSNTFDCAWLNERFTLLSKAVDKNEKHRSFVELLLRRPPECHTCSGEIHFFTVSSQVFALITNDTTIDQTQGNSQETEYQVRLLNSYASIVQSIHILLEQEVFLIILECGTIDIWYKSRIANRIERQSHHTGTQFVHSHFSLENNCFYYTNEHKVVQLHFEYDAHSDTCHVREQSQDVPGIVAVTWAQSLQQLVCLSNNNIFYRLCFESMKNINIKSTNAHDVDIVNPAAENTALLHSLTPKRAKELFGKANSMQEQADTLEKLHMAIEQQCLQQQLIAVGRKIHLYKHLCKATLEYNVQLPTNLPDRSVLIQMNNNNKNSNNAYAILYLHVTKNSIFQASSWLLLIEEIVEFGTTVYNRIVRQLHLTKEILYAPLAIVLPIHRLNRNTTLPNFKVNLVAFVTNTIDSRLFLALNLPIEIDISWKTYHSLFSHTPTWHNIICDTISQYLLKNIVPCRSASDEKFISTLPKIIKFKDIKHIFKVPSDTGDTFDIYFNWVSRDWQQTILPAITLSQQANSIILTCTDAVALYCLKLLLLLYSNNNAEEFNPNDPSKLEQKQKNMDALMQFQCTIERAYDNNAPSLSQEEEEESELTLGFNQTFYLESLKRVHQKMRTNPW